MIKSLFIAVAPLWLVATLILGIQTTANNSFLLGLSLILSAVPLALFLAYILSFKSLARTSKNLYLIQFSSLLGVMLCVSLYDQQSSHIQTTVFSVISYLFTLLYIYWYSDNNRQYSQFLKTGEKLPDFSLSDNEGNIVTATELRTKQALFMFTRGNWCPLCMAQIHEVVDAYKELEELGVQVVIIASQPEKNTQQLAARFNVPFLFLIDKEQKLGQQLGIIHHNGLPFGFQALGHQNDQYYPTIIATDKSGTIIYSDQTSNYRVRPEPEDFIKLFYSTTMD